MQHIQKGQNHRQQHFVARPEVIRWHMHTPLQGTHRPIQRPHPSLVRWEHLTGLGKKGLLTCWTQFQMNYTVPIGSPPFFFFLFEMSVLDQPMLKAEKSWNLFLDSSEVDAQESNCEAFPPVRHSVHNVQSALRVSKIVLRLKWKASALHPTASPRGLFIQLHIPIYSPAARWYTQGPGSFNESCFVYHK